MIELANREKMNSPLNLEWCDDFMNPKTKLDVLDPFIDSNEGSIESDDCSEFSRVHKSDLQFDPDEVSEPITSGSRKRNFSSASSSSEMGAKISKRKKKPKGMPKRPLSGYNLFFHFERSKIQEAAEQSGEQIGFEGLAKIIGKKWKELSDSERAQYDKMAGPDTARYRKEMEAYNELQKKRTEEKERVASTSPVVDATLEAPARGYESNVPMNRSAPTQQPESFMVAPSPQSMTTSSREEFLRIHSLTAPHIPSQFRSMSQNQAPNRAPFDNSSSSGLFQSRYEDTYQSLLAPPQGAHQVAHHISIPPPPQNAEPVAPPNSFHMPPGMEIVLSDRSGHDRKYCVQYTCYSMTRDAARKYIDNWTSSSTRDRRNPAPPQQGQSVGMSNVQQSTNFQNNSAWMNF